MTSDAQDRGSNTRNLAAFWFLGLINNSGAVCGAMPRLGRCLAVLRHVLLQRSPWQRCSIGCASKHSGAQFRVRPMSCFAHCGPLIKLSGAGAAYVVMIAGANQISAGSIGLVYLAAILPSLAVKLSAPYW